MTKKNHIHTTCVHAGELPKDRYKAAISPLYMSTAYDYEDLEKKRYPRYFNTPNQEAIGQKIAALENTDSALVFGSGMAAISAALLAFLQKGDHVVFQATLYGGTVHFIVKEFQRFGIEYSFVNGLQTSDFENALKPHTKIIYVETPSNPLLHLVDLAAIAQLAKKNGLLTLIDNTFATPINQNPIDLGIDVVLHSATKYMAGHSDLLAGALATSTSLMEVILSSAINYGGNLSEQSVWLLDRSLKTLALRVEKQNANALAIAQYLEKHPKVLAVHYPGLSSHPQHKLALRQMKGFGGMMSFELASAQFAQKFVKNLKIITPAMSLAGVESTVVSPLQTSHALLTDEQRAEQGIGPGLLRFSTGIEHIDDLIFDLEKSLALL